MIKYNNGKVIIEYEELKGFDNSRNSRKRAKLQVTFDLQEGPNSCLSEADIIFEDIKTRVKKVINAESPAIKSPAIKSPETESPATEDNFPEQVVDLLKSVKDTRASQLLQEVLLSFNANTLSELQKNQQKEFLNKYTTDIKKLKETIQREQSGEK